MNEVITKFLEELPRVKARKALKIAVEALEEISTTDDWPETPVSDAKVALSRITAIIEGREG